MFSFRSEIFSGFASCAVCVCVFTELFITLTLMWFLSVKPETSMPPGKLKKGLYARLQQLLSSSTAPPSVASQLPPVLPAHLSLLMIKTSVFFSCSSPPLLVHVAGSLLFLGLFKAALLFFLFKMLPAVRTHWNATQRYLARSCIGLSALTSFLKQSHHPCASPPPEGKGAVIAVIIICILLLAILGSVLYFLYKKGKICGRSGKQDL